MSGHIDYESINYARHVRSLADSHKELTDIVARYVELCGKDYPLLFKRAEKAIKKAGDISHGI